MLMAEVIVKMKFCNKTHRITVKMKDDGDLSLHVATDCPEVKYYAECLGDTITMEDITDISSSRIMSPENLEKVTMTQRDNKRRMVGDRYDVQEVGQGRQRECHKFRAGR